MLEDSKSLPDIMTGVHGDYRWMTSTLHRIDELLALCPELVLGKYLAVTSCDSGPLNLRAERHISGWESRAGIAYSPQITSFELLPPHSHYDEWYVLEAPVDLGGVASGVAGYEAIAGRVDVFVNSAQFIFDPGNEGVAEQFWRQIESMRPYAYISEMDACWLTVVCSDQKLHAAIEQKLRFSVH